MAELTTQDRAERARNKEILTLAHAKIGDNLLELVDRLLDLAKGALVIEHYGEENERVYRLPPSLEALKYVTDRFAGKPVSRQESGQIGDTDESIEDSVRRAIARRKEKTERELTAGRDARASQTTAVGPIGAPVVSEARDASVIERARSLLS